MGFWKKLFSEEDRSPPADEDAYALEWRNRFLAARKSHLLDRLEKAGRSAPKLRELPEKPEARNQTLIKQIKRLEDMI